jgi:cell division protein FtsI/penicillin-binding protein 2
MNQETEFKLNWRFTLVGIGFFLMGIAILIQLVRIQISPSAEGFLEQGDQYAGIFRTMYPARGQIYDRWGNLLAGNKIAYQIGIDLGEVQDPESIALAMAVVLDEDYEQILRIASQSPSPTAVYAVLADYVSPEKVLQLKRLVDELENTLGQEQPIKNLEGLVFSPHLVRSYPEKDLAANVLGFVSREGYGYFGVEEKFDDLLSGVPEAVWIPQDPNQVDALPDIPPGASLILTLDRVVQAEIENILDLAVESNGAESGTIVVMDPKTGEILAMASNPRFDLNEYWKFGELIGGSSPFNRSISKDYEPGSVFKVLTMASALDLGVVEPDTPFLDTGVIEVGGVQIRNWNLGAWGPQDMLGCMQHSLNVCLAWVGTEVGPKDFYDYMQDFGFGHATGIDLSGEVVGRLKVPGDSDWYAADLGTNSFGQGISVTPVQMLMAISALANDGQMVVPHVVRSMVSNGHQYAPQPQVAGIPISSDTARTISLMLATSLEKEASSALVDGYQLAGKTGTAEIPTPYGYTSNETNTSFVGWGPISDSRFLVYIWLEKPTSSIWGSEVAAPIFSKVVERLVVLLNIPPDNMQVIARGQ